MIELFASTAVDSHHKYHICPHMFLPRCRTFTLKIVIHVRLSVSYSYLIELVFLELDV